MRNHRPQEHRPDHGFPGRLQGRLATCLVMLGAGMLCAVALAAPPAMGEGSGGSGRQDAAAASGYVGSETCATCHNEVAKGFASNPHTKMVLMHGANGATCENCHGPGKAHVEGGGDVTKIFDPAKASPKDVAARCLTCHASAHPDFERSPHAKANVSCVSCHSIHKSEDKERLLRAAQPTLCFQCHTDTKAAFNMPFHHQVNEGLIKCTDCHDVHGTFEKSNLRSRNDSNLICTKCHTEKRGPFVYEHTPVKAEGCMGCHNPHGSQNARMLNMPSINALCNQCHSPVAAATIHGQAGGSSELVPCTSCHTYIHGSNMNVAFLR